MPELSGFQDSRSGFKARDSSPDSIIFTAESSNFSLFSSASASVDRCSFASDAPDQDSVSYVVSRHLAGHELSEVLSGPDPDPNKHTLVHKNSIGLSRKEKTKVQKLDSSEAETTEDENIAIGSARNSFRRAVKECQDRRSKSDALSKKSERRRPVSLDLNNPVNSPSPRLGIMSKQSATSCKTTTATFLSPGTPNYRQPNVGIQKGWSSERVPPHANPNRRNPNAPFLHNGKTLPSKWEDAERWILSPVLGDGGAVRTRWVQQTQRRPKSKSGPLGPPGVAYYQMFSPAGPMFEGGGGGDNGKLFGSSPFSTGGVMNADGSTIGYGGSEGGGENFDVGPKRCMARSISIHGFSETISQSSLPVHQDEKYLDGANVISRAASRRDMATQMSPENSDVQSSRRRHSSSLSLTFESHVNNMHSGKPEIRDVPVDERVTMTRWSKNSTGNKNSGKGGRNGDDWKKKDVNFQSGGWEVSTETSKSISEIQREEAKITAWENLQKAKAEAALRKLEMKLEKRRSSSMDKIIKKLKCAQKKAQEMRSSVSTNQIARPSDRALFFRRTRPVGSLSGCFSCHAF